jgi:hypothetical protein
MIDVFVMIPRHVVVLLCSCAAGIVGIVKEYCQNAKPTA